MIVAIVLVIIVGTIVLIAGIGGGLRAGTMSPTWEKFERKDRKDER